MPRILAWVELPLAQFSSVTQSCPTLCDPMNHSTPGLPVHHRLPESTQTYVHWVGDAIQPSPPLSSPSPPALYLSQHQGLFKWVRSSHQVWQNDSKMTPCGLGLLVFTPSWDHLLLSVGGTSNCFFFFFFNNVHETAMGLHVFPIPIPPPTTVTTQSL